MTSKIIGNNQLNICEFCKKTFSSLQALSKHKTTAAYCLNNRNISVTTHICKYCEKSYAQQDSLVRHQKNCVEKSNYQQQIEIQQKNDELTKNNLKMKRMIQHLNQTIKEKDALIHSLECKLKNKEGVIEGIHSVKPQPININNSSNLHTNNGVIYNNARVASLPISNIQPFTLEFVRDNLDRYTMEDFQKKERGVIEFINKLIVKKVEVTTNSDIHKNDGVEEILTEDNNSLAISDSHIERNYVCTDTSRNKFHRLTDPRTWEKDAGATFLELVMNEIGRYSHQYYIKLLSQMPKNSSTYDEYGCEKVQDINNFYHGLMSDGKDHKKLFLTIKSGVSDFASL